VKENRSQPVAGDIRDFGDNQLVRAALTHDGAAWRELMRRHTAALLEAAREAGGLSEVDADEAIAALWRSLASDDMRELRAFDSERGAALLSWLTVRLCRLIATPSAVRGATATAPPSDIKRVDYDDSPFMTVDAVARRWNLDRKTVYGMIEHGEISARRCGRLVRIPRKMIESFESQASVDPERHIKCR
jgi:excisionase family DNA binding protein